MSELSPALRIIKIWEGCELKAYEDKFKPGLWTIGWGCTGKNIKKGLVWTQEQADEDLVKKVNDLADKVNDLLEYDLDDCQLSALISFSYNLGIGALRESTLLRKINADGMGDPLQFLPWCNADGKREKGLQSRRIGEMLLYKDSMMYRQPRCASLISTYYK